MTGPPGGPARVRVAGIAAVLLVSIVIPTALAFHDPSACFQQAEQTEGETEVACVPIGVNSACIAAGPSSSAPEGQSCVETPANPPNGAYPCNSGVPIRGVDTDGDWSPDAIDTDDDCDHVADVVESRMGMFSLDLDTDLDGTPDAFDMMPTQTFAAQPVKITVYLKTLSQVVELDDCCGTNWGDPYVSAEGGISTVSAIGPVTRALTWTNLQKTNHPVDVKEVTFAGTLGTAAVADALPQNFLAEQWSFRDSSADYPKVAVILPLWDDDGQTSSAPDDPYGSQSTGEVVRTLLQMALRSSGDSFVPISTGWTMHPPDTRGVSATLAGNLQNNVKACAVIWASLVAGGAYEVGTGSLPNGATGGQC